MPIDTRRLGDASYVHVRYIRRGRTDQDEILCRPHFDQHHADGMYETPSLQPMTYVAISPWTGEPRCNTCEAGFSLHPMTSVDEARR